MKIAYLVTDLGLGGTQGWVEYAATELAARGHRMSVCAEAGPAERADRLRAAGVEVHILEANAGLEAYERLLRRIAPDVVHLHVWRRREELQTLRRRLGIPLAVSYHHVPQIGLRTWIGRLVDVRRGWRFARSAWQAALHVDAHIGCCRASERGIRRELWPVVRRGIYGLPNAIPLPPKNDAGVLLGPARFLQVGTLDPRKNPHLTLRAFAQVRRRVSEATLTLVGDGPLRAEMERFAAQHCPDSVRFCGELTDVASAFDEGNILVLPSRSEGLPYVLLEGAGKGMALIASDVGGNSEVVRPMETGLLLVPNDEAGLAAAMLRLAADVELRRRLGDNARRLVENEFGLAAFLDRLLSIYEQMLSRSGCRRARLRVGAIQMTQEGLST